MGNLSDNLTDRQTNKYIRRGRGRGWKNLLWYLFGFLSPLIMIGTAAAIALFAIPVSTYTGGNNDYFIPEIANGTLFNFIQNYQKYTVGDMPIVQKMLEKYVDDGELGKYIEIDYDNVNTIKLDGSTFNDNFDINNYVTVVATIRSLGLTSQMGDFGNLSAFASWDVVTDTVDPTANNFVPELYYYKVNTSSSGLAPRRKPITDPDGNTYARAFNDDKTLVSGAVEPFYYPALFDLPLFDMTKCIGNRIGTSSAKSLLKVFGIEEDSMLSKIVGDRTVTGLGSLTTSDIKLTTVMDLSGNETLRKILTAATGVENADDITLANLESDFNTSAIKLSAVADLTSNTKLSNILTAVTGVSDVNDITLGDLEKEWNTSAIKLSTVMDFGENTKLQNILCDVTGVDDVNAITLGDLESELDTDNIRLETFLPESENQDLYDIIRSAQGLEPGSVIRVGSLNGMKTDNIKMTAVIPYDSDSEDLYRILSSCCRDENGDPIPYTDLTVGDVHKLDSNNALLKDLLKNVNPEDQIAKILAAACYRLDSENNRYYVTYNELTVGDLANFDAKGIKIKDVANLNDDTLNLLAQGSGYTGDINNLTVGSIETFSIKNVHITNVINETTENGKLFTILESALGIAKTEMTVGDLDNFNINNCKLSTVLSVTNNETLYNILLDATGKDSNTVTIGDLDAGIDFDNVKLTSILPYTGNEKMYDILVECTSATSYDNVTISSLETFDTAGLHLTTVLPYAGNETMYNILVECTSATSYGEVTIASLSTFDTSNLHLTSVMSYTGNETMFDILIECTGASSADDITISSLSSFDTDNLHLAKVLDPASNAALYDILREGLGASSNEDIKMSDFTNFDITTVSLKTVLTDKNGNAIVTGNAILDQLRNDESVTIGNIGTKFDEIELYDAYGEDVFTTDSSLSARGDKYRKEGDNYIYDDVNGTYYVSKNANIWLLFCYDATATDSTNGRVTTYTPSTVTFKNLTDGAVSSRITDSTIYNLVAAGIISEGGTPYKNAVTKMTITEIITYINTYLA